MAELKRDPSNPIPSAAGNVGPGVVVAAGAATKARDDVLNGAIWYGESAAELIHLIRDDGDTDGSAEAPRPQVVERL